jgi:glycosyltransferase involved in cell wall biosynthesis
MTILFQNRDSSSWVGGDSIQLDSTRKALEELGIKTEFYFDPVIDIKADIVHCFNFSMSWTKYHVWNARQQGKKVVCSMIYHETDQYVSYEIQQAMINELHKCIFLTEGELERVRRHLTIPDNKIVIIPNGINSWWFEPVSVTYPSDILTVGRIDANKGQLAVAKVCKKLGLKYVCIGAGGEYAELVKKEGAIVIPVIGKEELKKYYAGCKVYACPSYKEIMPLTVMEAGSQGKPIIMTNGCEWDIPFFRMNYNDEDSIERSLLQALASKPDDTFKKQLEGMTWEKVAMILESVYKLL